MIKKSVSGLWRKMSIKKKEIKENFKKKKLKKKRI